MPMTTIWHHDFWSLLPINIGKVSVLTTWLSHIQSTKGIVTSQTKGPMNSTSFTASQHQHHRHYTISDLCTAPGCMVVYSQSCVPMA